MSCRYCKSDTVPLLDLGYSPPSNQYIIKSDTVEYYYPLRLDSCVECGLLQTSINIDSEILFDENYSYFSSYSTTWIEHCKRLSDEIKDNYKCNSVVEIASNDGYLLEIFKDNNINAYGIEPTKSTAQVAIKKGLDVVNDFLTLNLAKEIINTRGRVDILIANNVLANVPNLKDFIESIYTLLSDEGTAMIEFPYAKNLVEGNQFDTIYHEHYSYFTLSTVKFLFNDNNLEVVDVKEITTHGGSLRIYAQRSNGVNSRNVSERVSNLLSYEHEVKIDTIDYFHDMQEVAFNAKIKLLNFLIDCKIKDDKVVAYGAAAKGNTLLNYCGIKQDLIEFVIDRNPYKVGKLLPGSRIPIKDESELITTRPDYILILPWNLTDEVIKQLEYSREWGAKFVTAIPSLTIK